MSEETQLDDFTKQGFLVIKSFFSREECESLREISRDHESYKLKTFLPLMNPHKEDPRFLTLLRKEKLHKVLESFVGGKIRGLQTQFFYCHPGTSGFAWHQDNFYVQAEPANCFISAWLALEKVTKENGCLKICPKSHLSGLFPVIEKAINFPEGQDPNGARLESVFNVEDYEVIPIELEVGDLVIIHSQVLHASFDNASKDKTRNAFLMTFVKEGTLYRQGFTAKREDFNVYQ
ncbi:MAG: phytanoyl-CoA dioxygenase family protein [Alphaproteobacteria bacterium]|nr:phytanoyl-CoA dioxygenase family protein [Alphaproteobacteria bacterium]